MRFERELVALFRLLPDREQAHVWVRVSRGSPRRRRSPCARTGARCSGRASALAPASMRTEGLSRDRMTTAIAGRRTPGSRRMCMRPAASIAPVFPAKTTASASPSPTARHAATRLESGFARTASAGFSCIAISSAAATSRVPGFEPRRPEEDDLDAVARRLERALDHSGRTAIAPEGVDRYAHPSPPLRRYGAGAVSGSTSRPSYVLQFGQTWCGRFGRRQTGHSFTRGASRRCVARRLSRREFAGFLFRNGHRDAPV